MTVNYENGKIYQLVNFVNDYVYVGSTCGSISKRLHNHKRKYLSGQAATRKLYQMVDEIGWDNFRMILVENYPCSCRADLLKRDHHIQQVPKDRLLNMIGAYTTKEEKIRRLVEHHKHSDQWQQYMKRHREEKKEHYAHYKRQWELKHKAYRKRYFHELHKYQNTWGGARNSTNLLNIDPTLFE